jgi:hypothetical protein
MKKEMIPLKKRLMFLIDEDFYFLVYNILIFLDETGCVDENKPFNDLRKFSFLIDFISNSGTLSILNREKISGVDRQELNMSYARGSSRTPILNRILFTLEKRGILKVVKTDNQIISFYLQRGANVDLLLKSESFTQERMNSKELMGFIPRLRTSTLKYLMDRIYQERGVYIWHD